jgi:hypothetical protein
VKIILTYFREAIVGYGQEFKATTIEKSIDVYATYAIRVKVG